MGKGIDHRWGSRFPTGITTELRNERGEQHEGVVLNVSLSGALIRTTLSPRLMSRLYVHSPLDPSTWTEAFVVRKDDRGLGIEWVEPGVSRLKAFTAFELPQLG